MLDEGRLSRVRRGVWRRTKSGKVATALLCFFVAWLLSYFGAFSPVLSPLIYPRLAPGGWHNVTPHGKTVLYAFAASADSPGLMFACGVLFSITLDDPSTWIPDQQLHFWRSQDGGAHWNLIHPPFGGQQCDLTMPVGEPHTVFATVDSSDNSFSASNRAEVWVSQDTGMSWKRIATTIGSPAYQPDGPYYRHGLLYGYGLVGESQADTLSVSADDGATWTPISGAPSALEQQGWRLDPNSSGPVPDYRGDTWSYRVVSMQGQPPMLEHSTDDARTWTTAAPLGTESFQATLLATTPLHPGDICAAHSSGKTTHASMLSSTDGGATWQEGVMPPNLTNTSGETEFSLHIGANGDCYQGYHYHRPGTPKSENDYTFLRLASSDSMLKEIPLGNDQNIGMDATTYVPAGGGMPARLIINSALSTHNWATLFSGLATETDGNQLLWTAVP